MKNVVHHGQRNGPNWCMWRTPAAVLNRMAHDPLVSDFLVTFSGYFPKCWRNAAWRPNPLGEAVVTLCLDGRGWVKDVHNRDSARTAILPGEVLVVPPNAPHSYGADEKSPWTHIWFHATGSRVIHLLAQMGVTDTPHKGCVSNVTVIRDSLNRINELRREGCGRAVMLECAALGQLVFARLYTEGCLKPVTGGRVRPSLERAAARLKKLERVTSFLEENYTRDLALADVAAAVNVSESWLYHAFPEHTGLSPLRFAIHLRLNQACRALATSDRKLEDIAASIGYDDSFYFSRLFKKHIGVSPSEYRRMPGLRSGSVA